ncbi:MAG: Thymidine kinase [Anaerocolumna sp.]|nr:Thymidine kinase [Anaerocolumna sp.]
MSKLYFKYGCMNSSKSTNLLMIKHNYEEQGFRVILFKPSVDDREGAGIIKSRVGMESKCTLVYPDSSIFDLFQFETADVVMVDEAQFLSEAQVDELYKISFKLPVLCFGLLVDFSQHLFPGSKRLLELSESLQEIKTVCKCGKKATINARFDSTGHVITKGEQIDIGGNEKYKALCKECFEELKKGIALEEKFR